MYHFCTSDQPITYQTTETWYILFPLWVHIAAESAFLIDPSISTSGHIISTGFKLLSSDTCWLPNNGSHLFSLRCFLLFSLLFVLDCWRDAEFETTSCILSSGTSVSVTFCVWQMSLSCLLLLFTCVSCSLLCSVCNSYFLVYSLFSTSFAHSLNSLLIHWYRFEYCLSFIDQHVLIKVLVIVLFP